MNPKIESIIAKWIVEKKVNVQFVNETKTVINIVIKTRKNGKTYRYKRGIPTTWTDKDLAAYILSTNDLPTPAKARKLQKLKEQQERNKNGS